MKEEKMKAYDRYTFKTKQKIKRRLLAVGVIMVLSATVIGGIKLGKKINLKKALKQEGNQPKTTQVENVAKNDVALTGERNSNEQIANPQNDDNEITIRIIENNKDVTSEYQDIKDAFEIIIRERAQKREDQNQVESTGKSSESKVSNTPTLDEEFSMEM